MRKNNAPTVGDDIFVNGRNGPRILEITRATQTFVWCGTARYTRSKGEFRPARPGDELAIEEHRLNVAALDRASSVVAQIRATLDKLHGDISHAHRWDKTRGPHLLEKVRDCLAEGLAATKDGGE